MEENPKKYRITNKEGADLFLGAIHPQAVKAPVDIEAEQKAKFRRMKRKSLLVFSALGVVTVIMAVFAYNLVRKFRAESIETRDISLSVMDFETRLADGSNLSDDMSTTMQTADSLMKALDRMVFQYPEKDTFKTMWASVLVHKYEKYIHFALKNSIYNNLDAPDTTLVLKARRYNKEYTNLIPILYALPDFYRFWDSYKVPPRLSGIAPKQFEVEALIDKAKEMEYISRKNSVALEVHFPILGKWMNYMSNTVIPQIYEWDAFWTKYKQALGNTNDKLGYDRIMNDLVFEYPNLQILKDNNNYSQAGQSHFRLGMVSFSLAPVGSNVQAEMAPYLDYLKKSFNIQMDLVQFNDYYDLYQALKLGKVDFAVLNFAASANCYFAGVGLPIAQRSWNRILFPNLSLYGVNRTLKNDNDMFSGKIATTTGDDYLFFKYFDGKNIDINRLLDSRIVAPTLDALLNMINSSQCGTVVLSDEELYYLQSSGQLKSNIVKYRDIGSLPLDVMWARDSMTAGSLKVIQNIIIPAAPADIYKFSIRPVQKHPYGDWDNYENALLINYYNDSRQLLVRFNEANNRIHLFPIISESDSASNRLKNELTEYLEETGFKVVNYNNAASVPVSKKPNDSYATLTVKKNNSSAYTYTFEVHKYDKNGRKVVYREQFSQDRNKFPADFHRKLFDMASYLDIFGTVTKSGKGRVEILTNVDLPGSVGSTVCLFKRNADLSDMKNCYARLTITESLNGKIVADMGGISDSKIRPGDIGVILNVKK